MSIWEKVKKWSKTLPDQSEYEKPEEVGKRQQDVDKARQKKVWVKWEWKF